MKANVLNIILQFCCIAFCADLFAQQVIPIDIYYRPQVHRVAISGMGGGNMVKTTTASASVQTSVDYNFYSVAKKNRKNIPEIRTLGMAAKWNPTSPATGSGDSLNVSQVAFVDNNFQFHFGIRPRRLRQVFEGESSSLVKGPFVDFLYTPYQLKRTADNNHLFRSVNMNSGYQAGVIGNSDFGLIGVFGSMQFNYLYMYYEDQYLQTFEQFSQPQEKTSVGFIGPGAKLTVYMNDLALYCETRRYFPLQKTSHFSSISNGMIISFGAVATGTLFKNNDSQNDEPDYFVRNGFGK